MVKDYLLLLFRSFVLVVQYSCYAAVALLLIPFLGLYAFDLFLYVYRLVDYSVRLITYRKKLTNREQQASTSSREHLTTEAGTQSTQKISRESGWGSKGLGAGKLFLCYDVGTRVVRHAINSIEGPKHSRTTKSE